MDRTFFDCYQTVSYCMTGWTSVQHIFFWRTEPRRRRLLYDWLDFGPTYFWRTEPRGRRVLYDWLDFGPTFLRGAASA